MNITNKTIDIIKVHRKKYIVFNFFDGSYFILTPQFNFIKKIENDIYDDYYWKLYDLCKKYDK